MSGEKTHRGWRWDEVQDLLPWQIPDGNVIQTALEMGNQPPIRVYDLGCGIGRHTVFFAEQGHEVYASDISKTAVDATRRWLDELGVSASLYAGHFLEVDFPDDFFDLVVSINTINHGRKHETWGIIEKVCKMLKPGGVFQGTLRVKRRETEFYAKNIEVLDPQTFVYVDGEERGIPHFFAYLDELPEMFSDYELGYGSFTLTRTYVPPFTVERFSADVHSENLLFKVKKPVTE